MKNEEEKKIENRENPQRAALFNKHEVGRFAVRVEGADVNMGILNEEESRLKGKKEEKKIGLIKIKKQ